MTRHYDYEQAHKTRITEEEKARILKVWRQGEFTVKDMAQRFSRSHKSMSKILRDSGALNKERDGKNLGGLNPSEAPE